MGDYKNQTTCKYETRPFFPIISELSFHPFFMQVLIQKPGTFKMLQVPQKLQIFLEIVVANTFWLFYLVPQMDYLQG